MGLGNVIQGGGAGGYPIRVGGVGDYPLHGKGPEKFPAHVFHEDYREEAKAMGVWDQGIPKDGDRNVGGGV